LEEIGETGSRSTAKIKILSSDVNMFIKHVMNVVTKNNFTTNI